MSLSSRLRSLLPAIVFGVGFLVLWELFVVLRDIKPYLLPKPSAIWGEITANIHGIIEAAVVSGTNALIGLVCGTVLGIVMALISSRFRIFSDMTAPFAAAINAMPIIALAPMFNNMFSTTSTIPRRLIVTIVVFFPVFLNVFKGLTQVEPVHQELMRSYAATDGQILRYVRLPNALPFLFVGLRMAASLAVIAAVVAEYFGGLQNGLGSRITSAAANSAYGRAWAYVTAACVLGLVFYVAAIALERVAMPWHASRRST